MLFEKREAAEFVEIAPADHGRIETRRIWCSSALNAYLEFPHVGQVFLIERESIEKKTGKHTREIALGITSRTPQEASPQRVLALNRGHWAIESVHYMIEPELRRGSQPHPNRIRPREHHALAPLRDRHPQILPETHSVDRRDDANSLFPHTHRARLFANDKKLSQRAEEGLRTNLPCIRTQ